MTIERNARVSQAKLLLELAFVSPPARYVPIKYALLLYESQTL